MSPCGMVMDYLRTFYTTDVRISIDPEVIVKVRWYKAPEGALIFPTSHAFGSSVWETNAREYPSPSIGEIDLSRKWDKGVPPPGVTGQGTQTPLSWFQDGIPASALPLGSVITDLCDLPGPESVLAFGSADAYFAIDYFLGGSISMNAPGVISSTQGLQFLLERLNGSPYTLSARLYKNDFTPDKDTILADLVEADFSGYGQGSVVPGDWFHVGTPPPPAEYNMGATGDLFFSHNGGGVANTVYGFYLVDPAAGALVFTARLATPYLMASNLNTLDVLAVLGLNSVEPS